MYTTYGKPTALDWLVLAPHPDDAEIGAGGTLARLARGGHAVGILELTRGEGGTQGDPDTRQAECVDAARILGLSWRGQLGLPDGGLMETPEQARALAIALRFVRPRVLAVPHQRDRHPDHFGAYHLAKRAVHLAALARADVPGKPHRISRLLMYQGNADITANILVDIEAELPTWEAAIRAHVSQFTGAAISETVTPEIVERRRARLMYWGTLGRARYCEAFESEDPLVLDPAEL
ncbi:bacillithiol biosynthesis deacetylase BshB1 [Deinococcus detaillensis]|uniref:Bacillithiol biosynthesis deacetylase BshB1 n=1 Tax=Deinococcus detaillensis TaxID=2592048 RepID=A0A553V2T3_9DEIO|nr:PIG-L family deacetylase [Deinococcus detaillensis]TSA86732.1 bacillithiol biosynthesis deacetylase BshB1 [Deinococcus detaillensis]